MRSTVLLFALALVACAPASTPPEKRWTVADFVAGGAAKKRFAGFDPARLAVADGPVPFRSPPWEPTTARNQGSTGLAVLPAFAGGETAAVVITDIWEHHPTPWVQPVYLLVNEYDATNPAAKRIDGTWSYFPVDLRSAFYSPYWRVTYLEVPADTGADTFHGAGAALRAARSVHEGALVVCPIVPEDTAIAKDPADPGPVRPFTLEPVTARVVRHAWVDGHDTAYMDFGRDLFTASPAALPDEAPLYAFVKTANSVSVDPYAYATNAPGATTLLELPFVLDDAPFAQSLRRRYDIALAPSMAVFVPADRPELRDALRASGVKVPDADPTIPTDVARAYTLRVATSTACFADATGFPGNCGWLDSESAIAALPRHTVVRTDVLVTAVTLRAGAKVLP